MDVEPSSLHKLIGQVEGATLDDDGMEIDCESLDIGFAGKNGSTDISPSLLSLQVSIFFVV
mgnify:CR=1 FL=1